VLLAALTLPASARAGEVLQRLGGTLTAPASGDAEAIALRYVRGHLSALGLDASDLDTLQAPTSATVGGVTMLRWRQAVDGIPAADSELRVNVTRDGRVLSVLGSPASGLSADTTPALTAGEAVRAVQDDVGVYRSLPRANVASVAINGLAVGPDRLAGTTDGAGNFAIESVPARIFPGLLIAAPGYDSVAQQVSVPVGATALVGAALNRNWAAFPGGATVTPGPGSADYSDQGCGPDAAIDQLQGSGWSTDAAADGKSMVVSLPAQVNVTEFVADPAEACGDDAGSATAGYVIETSTASADGPWSVAAAGRFSDIDRHRLNAIPAAADGVRHVRVTLLSSQGGGGFFDLSEFGVHGTQLVPVQPPPTPTPTPTPTPLPTVSAPTFSFPTRGRTTVKFKVTCAVVCDVTAKLTVDRPTAKKLGLGKNLTAASLTQTGVKAGKTELTLKLKSKAKKALLKGPKKRTYRSRIKATATYGAGSAPVSRSAQVTLKR
jgi:hypothetical protein